MQQTRPKPNEPPRVSTDGSFSVTVDGAGNKAKVTAALSAQINSEQAQSMQTVSVPFWMNDDVVADVFRKWQDPTQSIVSGEEVPQNEDGLETLMKRGAWKSVLLLSGKLVTIAKLPHHKIKFRLCRIIAMVKLRMFQAAYNEYVDIGKIDDAKNLYESYPELYPNRKGSMIPFSLRMLFAEVLYFLGKDPSLEALFTLLSFTSARFKEALGHSSAKAVGADKSEDILVDASLGIGNTLSADPLSHIDRVIGTGFVETDEESEDVWSERENRVIFSIATKLIMSRDYITALQMLNRIVEKGERLDPTLLSAIGRLYLQIGYVPAAEATFKLVESRFSSPEGEIIVLLNRGFVAFANDQYTLAIDHFTKVLSLDPSHVVAANNKALCYLYAGDVSKAIDILEEVLFSDPSTTLQESIVFNLCTMYDLSTDKSFDKRKKILQLVRTHAPDNFNLGALKLPEKA